MEQLLNKRTVRMGGYVAEAQAECPVSGEYVLPEYCPDVAVILKCFVYPRVQSRQWSGDQLLVDGVAVIRLLYLDEGRQCVRTLEFAQSYSCAVRGNLEIDTAVELSQNAKYMNCRAVSPRRIEYRGVVAIEAREECAKEQEVVQPAACERFYACTENVSVNVPCGMVEKILTVNESLQFDRHLPPAEMLLGGECCAVIKECKLLAGKAIVKGQVYVHQLYTDTAEGTHIHRLDYTLPFSQIVDVMDAREGLPCRAIVQVLSDTERCVIGPDGANSELEVSVKLLIQVQVFHSEDMCFVTDVYHCDYPVKVKTEELMLTSFVSQRCEETALSYTLDFPVGQWQEIVDAWMCPLDFRCKCEKGHNHTTGRVQIGVLARDRDGMITCQEWTEDYVGNFTGYGDTADTHPTIVDVRCRATEQSIEIQATLCLCFTDRHSIHKPTITDIQVQEDAPYATSKASALIYFAEAGESVWDIARRCRSAPEAVKEENNLSDETIGEDRVLIVPIQL